jgi:hypothetical protein
MRVSVAYHGSLQHRLICELFPAGLENLPPPITEVSYAYHGNFPLISGVFPLCTGVSFAFHRSFTCLSTQLSRKFTCYSLEFLPAYLGSFSHISRVYHTDFFAVHFYLTSFSHLLRECFPVYKQNLCRPSQEFTLPLPEVLPAYHGNYLRLYFAYRVNPAPPSIMRIPSFGRSVFPT